jgi:hypothetical protein
MPRTHLTGALLLAASLTLSCGAGPMGRQRTVNVARNDDPWLMGEGCTAATPFDPAPRIEVLAEGTGDIVTRGTVRVHYVASLPNGTIVHDTHEDSMPSEVILGSTKTICGFERALIGMRPGEQRRALIPWSLAFGETGRSPEIAPRTDLVFVIDLYLPDEIVNEHGSRPANPTRGGRAR